MKAAETTHTKTLPDGREADILALIALLAERKPEVRDLDSLRRPSKSPRSGFSGKRLDAADTSFPLIADGDGVIVDGRHRYHKLKGSGAMTAEVVTATPEDIDAVSKSASMGDMTSEDWARHQDWLYDLEQKSPGKLDGLFPQRAAAARPFGQMPEGYAERFHKRLKAELGQDKAAALRPDMMERLRARRGECVGCGKPNCEGQVCDCGKTLSDGEARKLRDRMDAGEDLRKEAGLAQRAVGRVVTNIVRPDGYGAASHLRAIIKRGPAANIRAIVSDTPAYRMHADRDLPYRRLFGLPAHREGVGHFTKNGPGSFRFSPRNPDGRASLEEVGDHGLAAIRKGSTAFGGWNKTMGNYSGKVQPGGLVSYRDRWDLDLAPGDRVDSGSKLLRWLASKVTSPITIEGRINPRNPLLSVKSQVS